MGRTVASTAASSSHAGSLQASTVASTTGVDAPPPADALEIPAVGGLGVAVLATLVGSGALLMLWRRRQT